MLTLLPMPTELTSCWQHSTCSTHLDVKEAFLEALVFDLIKSRLCSTTIKKK